MSDRTITAAIGALLALGVADLALINTRLAPAVLAERGVSDDTAQRVVGGPPVTRDAVIAAMEREGGVRELSLEERTALRIAVRDDASIAEPAAAGAVAQPQFAPEPLELEPAEPAPEDREGVAPMLAPTSATIYFGKDRATLGPRDRRALDKLLARVGALERLTGTVEGHADERGSLEHNDALSTRRAERAAEYLADRGIARAALRVTGLGERQPAVTGGSDKALRTNRRVVVTLAQEVE